MPGGDGAPLAPFLGRKSKAKPNGKKPAAEEKKVYLEPEYAKSRITDCEFRELVVLPREIDLNEWLASNSAWGRRAGAAGLGATVAAAGREAVQVATLRVLGDPQSSVCRGCAAHVASGLAVTHQKGGLDAEAWGGQPCSALRGLGVGPEQAWGSGS